jgi:mannose/fructose/N-acetylgalactosamine-specific phosphotransferase system component IIC
MLGRNMISGYLARAMSLLAVVPACVAFICALPPFFNVIHATINSGARIKAPAETWLYVMTGFLPAFGFAAGSMLLWLMANIERDLRLKRQKLTNDASNQQ